MNYQEQQIANLTEYLKIAKTRSGIAHKIFALQTDLTGNVCGISGTVETKTESGQLIETNVLWDQNGRHQTNPILDLIVEMPFGVYSSTASEVDTSGN